MSASTFRHKSCHWSALRSGSRALLGVLICTGLSIGCAPDHGLEPTNQGIRGTVHFDGTWPDSILEIRVAVFETYPVESFFDLSGYSDSIPLVCDSSAYEVRLPAGQYGVVAVVCRRSSSWDATCLLGFYRDAGEPETPRPVTVNPGMFAAGVDIFVDFHNRSTTSKLRATPGKCFKRDQ